jgi:ribose 5-phosphate isomerase B
MRIAIGCDHRGLETKQAVTKCLEELGFYYRDFGTYSSESVDYPDIAHEVGKAVAQGDFEYGVLICGTGIGMSIAANKIRGIRAALCNNVLMAQKSRQHNDANILCLGADVMDSDLTRDIVRAYLAATFEGNRHLRRVNKIKKLEESQQ